METIRKVLFVDDAHPVLKAELTAMGFSCDEFTGSTAADCRFVISDYFGAVIRSKITFDAAMLDAASQLRFIARVGAGMESIDIEYATQKGIVCFNSPEGNRDAVAEHALGMLLSLLNNLNRADAEVRKGIWRREANRGIEIKDKTIGIIGYGNMGGAFAQRLKGFGCKILAYDKYKSGFSDEFVTECEMETIYTETDILSLHVPLTAETRYLVDENYINRFVKNFWLINTSRGPVVNTAALVDALKSGKVNGAALDVLEYEKSSFEAMDAEAFPEPLKQLVAFDNVILSPHIAGWTVESKYKLAKVLADKIRIHFFG
jgi:D-3-phosphoglycerate dehydrogenase / 2-oxoglutarate reductase